MSVTHLWNFNYNTVPYENFKQRKTEGSQDEDLNTVIPHTVIISSTSYPTPNEPAINEFASKEMSSDMGCTETFTVSLVFILIMSLCHKTQLHIGSVFGLYSI